MAFHRIVLTSSAPSPSTCLGAICPTRPTFHHLQRLIGSLAIDCEEDASKNTTAIKDLLAFQDVQEITGHLRIQGCSQLQSLKGLSKLKSVCTS